MIIKKQTVETIKRALNLLLNINKSTLRNSENKESLRRAFDDMVKDYDAIDDFEQFLSNLGSGRTEDGRDVYFY